MSMVIIGENPPKSCYTCSWYNKVQCPVNGGKCYYRTTRHPSCPLIELPPHGRLIDIKSVEYEKFTTVGTVGNDYQRWWNGALESVIDNAPTVIEAEGETE